MFAQLPQLVSKFAATAQVNCPGGTCDTGLPSVSASTSNLQSAIQVVFGIVGVVAVIMVAIGGLQLVLSQGDPKSAAQARQTIIYAVIGLVVAISAEVIVTFVIDKL